MKQRQKGGVVKYCSVQYIFYVVVKFINLRFIIRIKLVAVNLLENQLLSVPLPTSLPGLLRPTSNLYRTLREMHTRSFYDVRALRRICTVLYESFGLKRLGGWEGYYKFKLEASAKKARKGPSTHVIEDTSFV